MKKIMVISVGPGASSLLTLKARGAIDSAETVFCASRHAALAEGKTCLPLFPFEAAYPRIEEARLAGQHPAILLSGDAGLYSLLPRLTERFGKDALEVIPGVSALQAFSASLMTPWQDAAVLSAHGRGLSPSALCHTARSNRRTFLFLDREHDALWIRETLICGGLSHVRVTAGSDLSYPEQQIGPAGSGENSSLCMALLENDSPESGLPPVGLPDEAFIRGAVPMTGREVRIQVLAELQLTPEAVVWDVGAGTGSVTVECARQCPLGQVYAVEQKEEAVSLIRQNTEAHHLLNVSVVEGRAPQALTGLPVPTHVFLGGTGRESGAILDMLESMERPVRAAATAVTLETVHALHERFLKYPDSRAVQLSAARLAPVGSYTMLRGRDPVFIFSATIGGKA